MGAEHGEKPRRGRARSPQHQGSPLPRRSPLPSVALPLTSRSSLLRGSLSIEELALAARRGGYAAFSICDRNALYGAVVAQRAGDAAGVRSIVGAEIDGGLPSPTTPRSPFPHSRP